MDTALALSAFDSLSQETRLEVFRLLVKMGPEGAAAGAISGRLKVPHNTLSFHLNHLSNAKLVVSRRVGRSIIYSANYEFISGLLRFLIEDCCGEQVATIRTDKRRDVAVIEMANCCGPAFGNARESRKGGRRG